MVISTQVAGIEGAMLVSLAAARLAWHQDVTRLDKQQPVKTHIRVKNGREQVIARRPLAIPAGAANLGAELIKLGRKATDRALSTPLLLDQLVTDTGLQVAPIELNARDLAKMCRVCERTTRNYITGLLKVGLIVQKKFHGTNSRYQLWINPKYVWETVQNPVEKHTTADSGPKPLASFLPLNGKNLPLIEILETQETPNNNIVGVDKLPPHEAADATGNPFTGNGPVSRTARDAGQASKERHQGRGAARAAQTTSQAQVVAEATQKALIRAYIESAFIYQNDLIYKGKYQGRPFTEAENRLIKNELWYGVYYRLDELHASQWDAFHRSVLRRIELVRDHLERRPGTWLPMPYAQSSKGYYDRENERGFAGTYAWWLADQERHRLWDENDALNRAETEMLQRHRLDKGQKIRARKSSHVHTKTLLQLHAYHCRKLKAIGGENALVRFANRLKALKIVAIPA